METAKKIKVLIVDDDAMVRDSLKSILKGYHQIEVCGETSEGQAALILAQRLDPDIVLMDSQIPNTDTMKVIRQIRECLPVTKVLLLTVHLAHMEPAREAGADECLLKDSSRHTLLSVITELCR